ncbi:hypothetical protein EV649_3594 [Kribbella sp. VKM Ac-2569]|uniref:hypothetical protein n=1 Tax=Kribbella sp. VKM Ac-2569 TaxID=2512220 RepID=UPI00102CF66E|nr:hypothetical protein [Kribbella sp. VKM Ac-2569]RZT20447.1 hypothetical protein EV649_3594 [Kribbella sp. VKM Ac-2569]
MANLADLSVLPELGKAKWTPAQIFGYEIALEGIRQAIGFYAQRIAAAEAADEPDAAAIATLCADQAAWAARGRALDPLDTGAAGRIRKEADLLLSDEDEGADGDEDSGDKDSGDELSEQDGRGD